MYMNNIPINYTITQLVVTYCSLSNIVREIRMNGKSIFIVIWSPPGENENGVSWKETDSDSEIIFRVAYKMCIHSDLFEEQTTNTQRLLLQLEQIFSPCREFNLSFIRVHPKICDRHYFDSSTLRTENTPDRLRNARIKHQNIARSQGYDL